MAAGFFRKLHMRKTIKKESWHYFGNFHCTDRVISFRYSLLQSTCKSIYVRTAKRQTCNLKPQFDVCGKRGLPQTVQSPNAHPSNVVRESKNIFVKYGGIGSCQVTHEMLICFLVGRVRTALVPPPAGESSPHTISLNVLSPQVQSHPDENNCVFRFEAAWDSSLHNSILLNRYTR